MDDLGTALLVRAANAITAELRLFTQPEPLHAELQKPGATFVTLTRDGQLRGCIGSLEAHRSLERDVKANAIAAAFEDPRFDPVQTEEWIHLKVEVSLLTPATQMDVRDEADAVHQLRPNVDGVIFAWRGRRSTFLPQVWESLPEPMEFFARLKQKAGLPADFWAEDVTLHRYEVRKWKKD